MKTFKKISIIVAALVLLFVTGCRKSADKVSGSKSDGTNSVKVITTIFPYYDWAKNIVGNSNGAEVELLIKNGSDLHSYQPSASDIIKISTCDVLICGGGASDFWVENTIKNASKKIHVINLMEVLADSVKEEELVEGMEAEKEENHEEADDEPEFDEHVWLSLVNAKVSCEKIAEVLSTVDSSNLEKYASNLSAYEAEIDGIWSSLQKKSEKTILVADRFPFRYLVDELGISYYAAFAGCSAETEASFETVAFLSEKLKELAADRVYVTETSDQKMAKTIIKNAGFTEKQCKIVVLNSMQNLSEQDYARGKNYISLMKENFEELK